MGDGDDDDDDVVVVAADVVAGFAAVAVVVRPHKVYSVDDQRMQHLVVAGSSIQAGDVDGGDIVDGVDIVGGGDIVHDGGAEIARGGCGCDLGD